MTSIRPSSSKNIRSRRRAVSLIGAVLIVGAIAASVVAVRGRAAGSNFGWPASFTRIFASRSARLAPAAPVMPIAVSASAGTTGPTEYATLKNAFDAINSGTHQGVITISVMGDTTETASAVLNASGSGSSSYTTVSIQPSSGTMSTISGSLAGPLIELNGADDITIDGRFGGSGRFLTFRNTDTADSTATTITLLNDASNNTIRSSNCEGSPQRTGALANGVIFVSTGATTGNDNNTITDNQVRDRSDATGVPKILITSLGTSASVANTGNTISNNELFNFDLRGINISSVNSGNESWTISGNTIYRTTPGSLFMTGILLSSSGTNTITQNTIRDLDTSASAVLGINLSQDGGTTTVSRNRIYSLESSTEGAETTGIAFFGTGGVAVTVVNNQISLVPSGTHDQRVIGFFDQGDSGTTFNAYFNSVLVGGTATGTNSTWACLRTDLTAPAVPTASAHTSRNNICFNNRTGGTGNHFAVGNQSTAGTFSSDYNIFVGTGATAADFFDYGASATGTPVSFATWKTSTSGDANSQASNPGGNFTAANMFISSTDLHLNTAGTNPATGAGTPVTGITTDYDGDTRDASTPEIGADEVTDPPPAPPEVSVAVSPAAVAEDGSDNLTYTFTRAGSTTNPLTVNFVVSGTADSLDYALTSANTFTFTAPNGTVTIPAGSATATVTIDPAEDTTYEANETTVVTVSSGSDYTVAANPNDHATGTILNDDKPTSSSQTFSVKTTDDIDHGACLPAACSLRDAIIAANANSDTNTISFEIPNDDAGHIYYVDDATDLQLSASTLFSTTVDVSDDGTIADIDPDWPHSWWKITPASNLPAIINPVTIDGYTQTGAAENADPTCQDGILRIELDGEFIDGGTGLDIQAGTTTVKGLAINRFVNPNLVSGTGQGIKISVNGNKTITGNFIGTDISGTLAADENGDNPFGNGVGVLIDGAAGLNAQNKIGGPVSNSTNAKNRNLISANLDDGVLMNGTNAAANLIQGNFIGTDAHGTSITDISGGSNSMGNGGAGVAVYDGRNNEIGSGGGNVISGNLGHGIEIQSGSSAPASGNNVFSNFIGTDLAGTLTLGNASDGVHLGQDAQGTSIGVPNAGNIITNNGGAGVNLLGSAKTGNQIRGNSIFANSGLGIDLGNDGVTANDDGDGDPTSDTAPNNLQNFPVITSAAASGGSGTITGVLDSGGSTPEAGTPPFRIDFYSSPAGTGDASGNGEGKTYLGSITIGGGSPFTSGSLSFNENDVITATATDVNGNTSEFSAWVTATNANANPSIVAATGLSQQQGTSTSNVIIATADDADTGPNSVTVTVTSATTSNGVTISNIQNANDNTGHITADIVATCFAVDPATFTLQASDGSGGTNSDTLTITVTANTAPALAYALTYSVTEGNSLTITPTTPPSDNGSVSSIEVYAPGTTYPGSISVNSSTGVVSINNAGPATNGYQITIRAKDNCDAPTDVAFTLDVTEATCTPAPSPMVAWLPGDGNAHDISGNGNNGTLQNGATFGAGKVNQAFSFNGSGAYLSIADSADQRAAAFSVDAWINVTGSGGAAGVIASKYDGNYHGWILDATPTGTIAFSLYRDSSNSNSASATVPLNTWVHLTGTYDGSNINLFVNGALADTKAFAVGYTATSTALTLGAASWNVAFPDRWLAGSVDELEFFNRALAGNEVADIYNASFAGKCRTCTAPPQNMVSWWSAENNANDILGTNNGTFAAGTYAAGKVGQAFSFDGSGASVLVPDADDLDFTSQFTLDAWVNPTDLSNDPLVLSKFNGSNDSYELEVLANGALRANVSTDGTTYDALISDPGLVPIGAWSHVATTFNAGAWSLYVNGVEVKSATSTVTSIFQGNATLFIGRDSGTTHYFKGLIDEVEVFNRALMPTEIAAIADAGNAGKCHTNTIQFSSATYGENENDGNAVITVTRIGAHDTSATIDYATIAGGSATAGTSCAAGDDFKTSTGTLNFGINEVSKTFNVPICDDGVYELDETVNLKLSNVTGAGASLGSQDTSTLTIHDNDPQPSFAIDDVEHNEGNTGTTSYTFTVTKTGGTQLSSSVQFQTVEGTATLADSDYQSNTGTLTFGPTDVTKQITVLVNGDNKYEPNEAFTVNLHDAVYATISDANGTGTITNDDPLPAISINDVTKDEGDDLTTTTFGFTVSLSNPSYQTITVDFATADDSATAPSDYTAVPTATLTFTPGQTTKTVSVTVNGDSIYELAEKFFVKLSNVSATATIFDDTGNGTISNDDAAPRLSITAAVTKNEGTITPPATTPFTFTVNKTSSTAVPVTVKYATADGTALADGAAPAGTCGSGDYIAKSGTLTFPVSGTGSNSQTITVQVCKDANYEPDETFFVNLSDPTDATITDSQGLGTITNDDAPTGGFVVNTTDDVSDGICDSHCTLRDAIVAANSVGTTSAIKFNVPDNDLRHFYYQNDTVGAGPNGALGNVAVTAAANDADLPLDVDPDWQHSWWSILPTSQLPTITKSVFIDGYTQTGATVNTLTTGDNAVLRIELNGASAGAGVTGLSLTGGSSTVRGLVINGFTAVGLNLQSGSGYSVKGNFVGTNVSGTLAVANTGSGLYSAAAASTIGGSTADANLISGNNGDGLLFTGGSSNSNTIQGNLIGTKSNGSSSLSNAGGGLSFASGALFNTVGGENAGEGNTIAFNTGDGVRVDTGGAGNSIRGNSIFSNGTTANDLGIDLGGNGITANDIKDPDTGPNNLQNFPIITSVLVTGSTRTITGSLNSTAGNTFTIDFYQNASCDNSGNGEGKTYLGSFTTAATDSYGNVSFTFHPSVLTIGQVITATATSDIGANTSEFSQCAAVIDGSPGAGDIQFKSATYTVGEAGPTATITVTRVGGSNGSVTSDFSTSNGTAQAPGDYTPVTAFPITYVEGETGDKTINITINNDSLYEGNETVNLSLGTTLVNATFGKSKLIAVDPHSAVLTITDDDAAPAFTIDDVTHNEGDAGTNSYVFTVTKTGSTALNASVNYATVNGTATAPSDFTAIPATTLTFLPGDTSKQVSVLVNGDTTVEPTEAFTVHLSNAVNATISDADGTGTILNDDTDVTVAVSPSAVAEDGATNLVYTFTRNGVTAGALTVNFSVSGTATFGTDYAQTGATTFGASSGTVTFGAGNSTATLTIDPSIDSAVESNETAILTVTSGAGYNVASPSAATGTINNDDTDVTVAVSPATVAEDGATNLVYTFTRNGVTAGAQTVNFSVGGTAAFGTDYTQTGAASFTSSSGTVVFGAGNSTATVTIDPSADLVFEPNETVILTVDFGAAYNIASPSSATGTITNDEAARTISIDDVSHAEGNSGTTTFAFTVTLSGQSSQTVTVDFATANGTATAGSDYVSNSRTLTFAPLETTKTINVNVNGDLVPEPNETFFVNLTNPLNATISDSQGLGTVVNDDTVGFQFEFGNYSVQEGIPSISIVVKRTGDTSNAATVDYATNDFTAAPATDLQPAHCEAASTTASSKCDYGTAGGRLRFAAGETSKIVVLSIVDDIYVEGDETLSMSLSNPSTGNLVSPSTAVITIQSNDTNQNATGLDNPYLGNAFFVRQHYLDFLLREPDTLGFNDWLSVLNNCQPNRGFLGSDPGCDRVHVSSGFFRSTEFGERGYWVYRFFSASLGRRPLYAEFMPEMRRLKGLPPEKSDADLRQDETDFVNEFMQRPEFTTIYNGITDAGHASAFIGKLEEKAGVTLPATVPPTQPGQPPQYNRQDLIDRMQNGTLTTAQTLTAFVEQKTVWDAYFFKAFVAMEYFGYLRRDPENAGYDDWVDVLTNGRGTHPPGDYRHLVFGFIYSEEYRERFGPK